jgi:hypothetical protein
VSGIDWYDCLMPRIGPLPDDPADNFIEFGIPRSAARAITRVLRTDVTSTVCQLLPGADSATAICWLYFEQLMLLQAGPDLVRTIEPGLRGPQANAAALHAMFMFPITVELIARHDAAHPATPLSQLPATLPAGPPPVPSDKLRAVRGISEELVAGVLRLCMPQERARELRAMTARSLRDVVQPGTEAWGGWMLLDVMSALNAHRRVLPEPGRTQRRRLGERNDDQAAAAGAAFELGRAVALMTALGLLDEAEQAR